MPERLKEMGPMSARERGLLAILAAAMAGDIPRGTAFRMRSWR